MRALADRSLISLLCFLLAVSTLVGKSRGQTVHKKTIKHAIAAIRSGKTASAKADAAENLANLMKSIQKSEITDDLVMDITSLLDTPNDSVRYWVAISIGNSGQVAKAAIPKLLEMLPKADCLDGTITSASGIRYALTQMGVKPPPPPKCEHEPIAG